MALSLFDLDLRGLFRTSHAACGDDWRPWKLVIVPVGQELRSTDTIQLISWVTPTGWELCSADVHISVFVAALTGASLQLQKQTAWHVTLGANERAVRRPDERRIKSNMYYLWYGYVLWVLIDFPWISHVFI